MNEILIVDDISTNLDLLGNILINAKYTIRAATSGELALASVKNKQPDLIILDINMPGMNGFDVCKQLKSSKNLKDIPIIFISANDDVAALDQAFQVGGSDYIMKPFRPREVLIRVQNQFVILENQKQLIKQHLLSNLFQLTAGIAHEINTPLGVCITASSFIQDICQEIQASIINKALTQEELEFQLTEFVQGTSLIETNLKRVSTLIDRFKELAQDQKEMPIIQFSLKQSVSIAFAPFIKVFNERKIDLILDIESIQVSTLELVLIHLLQELFQNSLDHAFDGSFPYEIHLNIHVIDQQIIMHYYDNGPGVPEAELNQIFKPFFTHKRGSKHCGLSACRINNLVHNNLCGQLSVSSPPGQGLTYLIIIPQK